MEWKEIEKDGWPTQPAECLMIFKGSFYIVFGYIDKYEGEFNFRIDSCYSHRLPPIYLKPQYYMVIERPNYKD